MNAGISNNKEKKRNRDNEIRKLMNSMSTANKRKTSEGKDNEGQTTK